MKYIFVVNPAAGQANSEDGLLNQLKGRTDFDFDIYNTKGPHDATAYVKSLCEQKHDEMYCFVACGGDGTINEVVNGLHGYENVCMSIWPCGSGNDYVKYFGGKERFKNVDDLLAGEMLKVDLMQIGNQYSLNVVSFGFDCAVLKTMEKVKRIPLIGGNNAYTTGVITSLFNGRNNKCKVIADGELLNPSGNYLLCTVANGQYVGGSYKCAPRSVINDGLLEVCLAKNMSLIKLVGLISKYKKGLHLDDEGCKEVIAYRQAKRVELISDEEIVINIDGEMISGYHFVIENQQEAMKLWLPKEKNENK